MIKEKRRKKRRVRLFLKVLLGLLLFLGIGILIIWKVFRVETVQVEGNELYDSKMIQSVILNDEYSWNSIYVYLKYRFMETEQVPFIDAMEVSLVNPTTLHIEVYEKGLVGYLTMDSKGENVYFDKDGFVVEISKEVIPDIPKVSGLECPEIVLYEKLPLDGDLLRSILSLTQALKKYDIIPDCVTYGQKYEPILTYKSVTVVMGDVTLLTPKLERVKQILPTLENASGTLHMEKWTEETTDIVFDKSE